MKCILILVIIASVSRLYLGTTDLYKPLEPSKGVIANQIARAYSSQDFLRIRVNVDFREWSTAKGNFTQTIQKFITPGRKKVLYREDPHRKEVQRHIQEVLDTYDIEAFESMFRGRIQPLLAKLPKESITDDKIESERYDVQTRTYYLKDTCNQLINAMNREQESGLILAINTYLDKFEDEEATVTPAPAGRRKRGTEDEIAEIKKMAEGAEALGTISRTIYSLQSGLEALKKLSKDVSEGRYPEGCISNTNWIKLLQAVYPGKSQDDLKTIKEDSLSTLSNFPMTAYSYEEGLLSLLFLVPPVDRRDSFSLFDLQYVPIRRQENKWYELKYQPPEALIDEKQQWIASNDPMKMLKKRCLHSWHSNTQLWCYGGLTFKLTKEDQCLFAALPFNGRDPSDECYEEHLIDKTELIPLGNGKVVITPFGEETISVLCADKKRTANISDIAIMEIPKGCHIETLTALFTTNALSPRKELGNEWEPYVTEPDDDPTSDLVGILTPELNEEPESLDPTVKKLPTWKTRVLKKPEESVWNDLLTDIKNWSTQYEVQVAGIILLVIATLYCICAPVSWPRCNCCVWFCKQGFTSVQAVTEQILYCWRSIKIIKKRNQLRRLRDRSQRIPTQPQERRRTLSPVERELSLLKV